MFKDKKARDFISTIMMVLGEREEPINWRLKAPKGLKTGATTYGYDIKQVEQKLNLLIDTLGYTYTPEKCVTEKAKLNELSKPKKKRGRPRKK